MLAENERVMIIDPESHYYGSIGTIKKIEQHIVTVKMDEFTYLMKFDKADINII